MNAGNVSLAQAIRGPILLILLGALFAADQLAGHSFRVTWPVLPIAYGLLRLLDRPRPGKEAGR